MTIAVIGSEGMLGYDLCELLRKDRVEFTPLDIKEIDITNREEVFLTLSKKPPSIIVNCAAYTNVEMAEDERESAFAVNQIGPKNLTDYALENSAVICHVSTDYVFDGSKNVPYLEDDATDPSGVYGASKLAGELEIRRAANHYIIRTSWLFGRYGKNFIATIMNAATQNKPLRIVNDQFGSPTFAPDLAKRIMEIIERKLPFGTYHVTNTGVTSWYEFALKALQFGSIQAAVVPISSCEYPSKFKRPKYTALSNEKCAKAGLAPMPTWQDAVERFVNGKA